MKIGLLDIDSKGFPNIPLMKLSAHHKQRGDTVEWYNAFGERYEDKDMVLPKLEEFAKYSRKKLRQTIALSTR